MRVIDLHSAWRVFSFSLQVEKSLQRIQSGQCNPMYTSQQSVENKVSVLVPTLLYTCSVTCKICCSKNLMEVQRSSHQNALKRHPKYSIFMLDKLLQNNITCQKKVPKNHWNKDYVCPSSGGWGAWMAGPPVCGRFPVRLLWRQCWPTCGGFLPHFRPGRSTATVQQHTPVPARYRSFPRDHFLFCLLSVIVIENILDSLNENLYLL